MLLGSIIAVAPAVAQSETSLPQVFEVKCDWAHAGTVDKSNPAPQGIRRKALTSSSHPKVLQDESVPMNVAEVAGVSGTRHFVLPNLGGLLVGTFISVYPDGRSVRTQNYEFNGDLSVHTSIGTCEVIE